MSKLVMFVMFELKVRVLIVLDYQVVSSLKETIYSFTGLVRLGIGHIFHGVEKYQILHFIQYTGAFSFIHVI